MRDVDVKKIQDYGKKWRTIRSTVHEHLNVRSSRSYTAYQELENRQLLLGILDKPERWNDHLRRYTNSITTQIVFGFRTTDIDDPKMHQLYQVSLRITRETMTDPRCIDVWNVQGNRRFLRMRHKSLGAATRLLPSSSMAS